MSDNIEKKIAHIHIKFIVWILSTYLIYSFVSVISKITSTSDLFSIKFVLYTSLIFVCMGVYAVIYQQLIKRVELSTVYSLKGIVIVYNLIWARMIFDEKITMCNFIGAALILCGIYLVGKSD